MPPAVLTNDDLSTFLDTSDEWISSRTGMHERRISHVSAIEMSVVASAQALACAGMDVNDLEMIIYGSCSNDEAVPNSASGVQIALGAPKAASMDVNTACTSFSYGLATATAMIQSGMIKNALVIGVESITRFMDWTNRNVAVLFGDGAAAVVLQATDKREGVLGTVMGCDATARETLRVRGIGCSYANRHVSFGDTIWDFDGQAIFKRAVNAMADASKKVMTECQISPEMLDLVVPHQANLRILEAMAKYAGVPMEKVMVTVHKYGNMSAATVPVALVEALEEGKIRPGANILIPAFGAGLTYSSMIVKWGSRITPLGYSDRVLPPCTRTGLEMINEIRNTQDPHGRSHAGLMMQEFAERQLV
jgi:3-oxoacyl-[acyl-carrier-protein] synthase III